ncbi:hypothetical protein GQ42DRAFT_165685 [Ramicandelaber brevisporus]|nr:hypothetical protein GQ42DRAFT_165685 [Ramicandelaber brevisporus]
MNPPPFSKQDIPLPPPPAYPASPVADDLDMPTFSVHDVNSRTFTIEPSEPVHINQTTLKLQPHSCNIYRGSSSRPLYHLTVNKDGNRTILSKPTFNAGGFSTLMSLWSHDADTKSFINVQLQQSLPATSELDINGGLAWYRLYNRSSDAVEDLWMDDTLTFIGGDRSAVNLECCALFDRPKTGKEPSFIVMRNKFVRGNIAAMNVELDEKFAAGHFRYRASVVIQPPPAATAEETASETFHITETELSLVLFTMASLLSRVMTSCPLANLARRLPKARLTSTTSTSSSSKGDFTLPPAYEP